MTTDTTNALRAVAQKVASLRGASMDRLFNMLDDLIDEAAAALATAQPEDKPEGADGRRRLRIACGCVMEGAARVIACRGHATRQAQGGGEDGR